jgi:Na+/H+ antiporter NhaD/arsenite permease-like protein
MIIAIFVVGYISIAFEHSIRINKAAPALVTGVLCWTVYILFTPDKTLVDRQLTDSLGEYAGILFFLMGAMTIVEIIDAHDGFRIITRRIRTLSKRKLLWVISLITFFLSPLLDNLTTTIVMISLLQRMVEETEDRLYFTGMIVIAANAGGVWSPIGDVTTTMLWLGGQITAGQIMLKLFLPSIANLLVPLIILSSRMRGVVKKVRTADLPVSLVSNRQQWIVFLSGFAILLGIPVFSQYN